MCDGNSITKFVYCDDAACTGPAKVWKQVPCADGTTCGGGKCLTHVTPPEKACSVVTDCGLPPTVCVGANEQLIFSDPTCDDGQCHWTQIVDTCGSSGVAWYCSGGTCYDPGMQTRGPITPTPSPDAMQPPPAPAHACATAVDCPQPPPACFRDSVVSYVHGVCRDSACSSGSRSERVRGHVRRRRVRRPVTRRLSRTEILHLVVGVAVCILLPAFSYARGEGGFAWTMFSRSDSFRLSVTAVDRAGQLHLLHPVELANGVEPALRTYLRGADRFRTWPVGPTFAARLPELARLGCRNRRYASVEVTLDDVRPRRPARVTRAHATCP